MLQFFNKKKGQKGFTLIELLVVIAIIGVLATIVLVSLNTAREKARDARRQSDVTSLAAAFELYNDNHSSYPQHDCPNPILSGDCSSEFTSAVQELKAENIVTKQPYDPSDTNESNSNEAGELGGEAYYGYDSPAGSNYDQYSLSYWSEVDDVRKTNP